MTDYISREAAIRAIQNDVPLSIFMKRNVSSASHAMGELCDALDKLPAADVREVVKAFWSRVDYKPCGHDYICSNCGDKNDRASNFCPNCGALMEKS